MRRLIVIVLACACLGLAQKPRPVPAKPSPVPANAPFVNPYSPDEIRNKQAVIETPAGTIVLDLLADAAPMHVAHFVKTARDGGYDGTLFHRVIRHGIIQGGDPLSKDPAAADRYGTGGLNRLKPEPNTEKHTRGAVSAVLVPNKPDSAGTQFFICIADQPALDGQYTVFARVAEGILVAQKLSEAPADDKGAPHERLAMTRVTIRDTPPPTPEPFASESVAELAQYRAVLDTSLGEITIGFTPEQAPEHVRNFLRLASAGVYDGTTWHRVVKGFVVQTGHMPTRRAPLDEAQQRLVRDLKAEFNAQPHVLGTVSMARLADPDTANTSFFIVTARSEMLDQKYTVFGRVLDGLDVVQKIEAAAVNGETPVERIELTKVRLIKSTRRLRCRCGTRRLSAPLRDRTSLRSSLQEVPSGSASASERVPQRERSERVPHSAQRRSCRVEDAVLYNRSVPVATSPAVRRILHIDMDAFYASVEQRDNPELRGKPVAVGGDPTKRGVVAAASYEARTFGVRSAIPMSRAVRLCPSLVIVRPDFEKYRAVSQQVFALYRAVTPLVEPLSLDEAYLDVTENAWGEPLGVTVARRIKEQIRETTGLTASAGVAPNKFLAKIASGWQKPDGLTVIAPERMEAFLQGLPVNALWGVGPKTAARLRAHGIEKLVDVRTRSRDTLRELVGSGAEWLQNLAQGIDPRPVDPSDDRKSAGSECTYETDLTDLSRIRAEIDEMARDAARWLATRALFARTVVIKVRYHDFTTVTRSHSEPRPTRDGAHIAARALQLLEKTDAGRRPVRLLGVSVHNLEASDEARAKRHPRRDDAPRLPLE